MPRGAGGGTDAVAHMLASLTQRDLGQPVNMVKLTGGSSVVVHAAIANAPTGASGVWRLAAGKLAMSSCCPSLSDPLPVRWAWPPC